jgi:hypothetical protein
LRKRSVLVGAQEHRGEAREMNDAPEAVAGPGEPVARSGRQRAWIYADEDDDQAVIQYVG